MKLALRLNRRGRETKTSSDASQEAPERARKDTPKEVKLQHEGSYPSVRLYKHSFSGFLATRPMSAFQTTLFALPAREFCFVHSSVVAHALWTPILYQKIRPADENFAARSPPAGLSGLSAGRSL